MNRLLGLVAGVLNHLLFAVTVYFLFGFLAGWTASPEPVSFGAVACDVALCLQFAISHSWLLLPHTRTAIGKVLPSAFYGTLFCTATCLSLLLTIACWRPMTPSLIEFSGSARIATLTAFYLTWPTLLYSLSLTGLGYQTGFTTWWYWVRRQKAPFRSFEPRSLYRWFRHPIYLSFAGLLWFSPRVSLDRAILIGVWTIYIAIGSTLKDRRLVHYLGDSYRQYQSQVVGYPGVLWGPLGKIAFEPARPALRLVMEAKDLAPEEVPEVVSLRRAA